jgi:hypothetical protein
MDYYRRGAQKFVQPKTADMCIFHLNKSEINISRTILLKQYFCLTLQEKGQHENGYIHSDSNAHTTCFISYLSTTTQPTAVLSVMTKVFYLTKIYIGLFPWSHFLLKTRFRSLLFFCHYMKST